MCWQAGRRTYDSGFCDGFLPPICFQILLADNLSRQHLRYSNRFFFFFKELLMYMREHPSTTLIPINKNKKSQVLIPRRLQLGLLAQIILIAQDQKRIFLSHTMVRKAFKKLRIMLHWRADTWSLGTCSIIWC